MTDSDHSARLARRAAARRALRRRRQQTAGTLGLLVVLAVVLVVVLSGGGGASGPRTAAGHDTADKTKPAPIIPGGPLAPRSVGGLAALYAPQNVVGTQPGTAVAYAAASLKPGLPGYLMIADRGNNRILVINPQGKVVFLFPNAADLRAGRKLYYDDDTFVEPGGRYIIANEEDNQAVVQVGIADHSLSVLFGHPGQVGAGTSHLNTPDDAYMLPDGTWTVADAYNCRVLFIRAGRIVKQYGHAGDCHHDPPRALGSINGDTPVPGGGVMVSEINGSWIDEFSPTGKLVFTVTAPVSYPSDPQPLPGGRILIADYANPGHVLIINHHGKVLWRFGADGGYNRLDHPSLAMPLPNGDVAVNDDYRHRIVIIDPRRNKIVFQYGHTDQPGSSHGFLNTPDGMDFVPAGPNGLPDYAAVIHP